MKELGGRVGVTAYRRVGVRARSPGGHLARDNGSDPCECDLWESVTLVPLVL
jgi:hypothetical protein